jgi:signal transduction histidine kinase
LNPAVRRNAWLIVLEALHNAARHSGAKRIALRIATDGSDWRIEVEDDGSGMNMSEHSQNGGLGLASMRERAEDIHASLEWLPAPAGGTIVRLQFNPRGRVMPWTRLAGRAARVT